MTTDNKTLAVDVLTAMSVAERVLSYEGYEQVIFELASSRAAVAELIAAGDSLTAAFRALGLDSSLINRSRLARDCEEAKVAFDAALARVKGESA